MSEWHRRLIAETRALQGLSPTIADDPVGIELAARFLTSATSTDAAPSPATEPASVELGAVQATRGNRERAAVGKSASRARRTAPISGSVTSTRAATGAARPEQARRASSAVTGPTSAKGA
jgi:hypothetical protein